MDTSDSQNPSQSQELPQEQSQNVAESQTNVDESSNKSGEVSIKIKTLTGKEIGLSIKKSDKTDYIKSLIEKSEGIPPEQQRLIFSGRQLDGNKTVEESNVVGGSVIHLVLSLRGGSLH